MQQQPNVRTSIGHVTSNTTSSDHPSALGQTNRRGAPYSVAHHNKYDDEDLAPVGATDDTTKVVYYRYCEVDEVVDADDCNIAGGVVGARHRRVGDDNADDNSSFRRPNPTAGPLVGGIASSARAGISAPIAVNDGRLLYGVGAAIDNDARDGFGGGVTTAAGTPPPRRHSSCDSTSLHHPSDITNPTDTMAGGGYNAATTTTPHQHLHYEYLSRKVPTTDNNTSSSAQNNTNNALPDTVLVNSYGDEYGLEYVAQNHHQQQQYHHHGGKREEREL